MFDYKYLKRDLLRVHKAPIGETGKVIIKVTVTPETKERLNLLAEYGKGKYGSAVIELAINLLYELVTEGNNLDEVAAKIKSIVSTSYMVRNTERLFRIFRI